MQLSVLEQRQDSMQSAFDAERSAFRKEMAAQRSIIQLLLAQSKHC